MNKSLPEINEKYLIGTGFDLLRRPEAPTVLTKPYDSFLGKTYRRNVLDNSNWPDPPASGWVLPPEWLSGVGDLLRTRFEVKYLDGVEFLAAELQEIGKETDLPIAVSWEARDEGYYAAHLDCIREFEVPRMDWDTETKHRH